MMLGKYDDKMGDHFLMKFHLLCSLLCNYRYSSITHCSLLISKNGYLPGTVFYMICHEYMDLVSSFFSGPILNAYIGGTL